MGITQAECTLRDVDALALDFYETARVGGADGLADGGGPLGFDITVAFQVDTLVRTLECDGVVETGCHRGDTTDYLARRYHDLPIRACEIDPARAAFTARRVKEQPHVEVIHGDSARLLPELLAGLERPLVFLDAHWSQPWPLPDELRLLAARDCVVAIDDFFIGHPRFGYDTYGDRVCGPGLVSELRPDLDRMFVGNPESLYPLPCLQVGRRCGTGYLLPPARAAALDGHPWFTPVPLRPAVALPVWSTARGLR